MIQKAVRLLLKNSVLINLLMCLILVAGIFASYTAIREIFPEFSLETISVRVPYPGADPEEVEEGICLKLEEAIIGIEGIEEVEVTAQEGMGSALIECKENAEISKVKDDVETEVDSITTFPDDAEEPTIKQNTIRKKVLSIAVWGDLPKRQLKRSARKLERELLSLQGISQIDINGIREDEIWVEVKEATLRKFDIGFDKIKRAISENSMDLSCGKIRTSSENIRLKVSGRRYNANEYANIPVITKTDGTLIKLGQIANIRDTFNQDDEIEILYKGNPCVTVNVFKTSSEDAINISNKVHNFLEKKKEQISADLGLTTMFDTSRMIKERLNILKKNGLLGLILVLVILTLFLNLRLSFWVSLGLPVSILGGLAIMVLAGSSLNMITMFGLIMILGLVVDDAIVVGESIYTMRQEGESANDAAVKGTAKVALPVVAAVLTTIMAFMPLFFIGGTMGKFIGQVPIPVIAALAVSLLEGLLILPVHLRDLPPYIAPKKNILSNIRFFLSERLVFFIDNIYEPLLRKVLHYRYVAFSLAITLLLVIAGLYQSSLLKFIFMPEIDNDFIKAKVELAPGTPIEYTKGVAERVSNSWREVANEYNAKHQKDLTENKLSIIGGTSGWKTANKNNIFEIAIELLPSEERNYFYRKLLNKWKNKVGEIGGAISTKFEGSHGGPGGEPIAIKLLSKSHNELINASSELMKKLKSIEGVFDVQSDYRSGLKEFDLELTPLAYQLGLNLSDIAGKIHAGFYGEEALRIQRGRDDVRVKVRYPEQKRGLVKYFSELRINTPEGNKVPLESVVDIKMQEAPSIIHREDRKKSFIVTADVNKDLANAEEIKNYLDSEFLNKLENRYNITYVYEGEAKEKSDTFQDLFIGFPLAILVVYFIIASIFRSYIQPILIMLIIPFGIIGAIIGHLIFNLSITMMSVFGIVALTGIVVNDAIILVENLNDELTAGESFSNALIKSGKRRFRPIILTTLTTFFGLMPLILETSMQAQILIPMAISIAFGVLFATIVTLALLPCLIAMLNDLRRMFYFIWNLEKPSRERVEPRAQSNQTNKE